MHLPTHPLTILNLNPSFRQPVHLDLPANQTFKLSPIARAHTHSPILHLFIQRPSVYTYPLTNPSIHQSVCLSAYPYILVTRPSIYIPISVQALACYMLKKLPEYSEASIVRTRNEEELKSFDIVVDVGGVYDPYTHRYDHHQR